MIEEIGFYDVALYVDTEEGTGLYETYDAPCILNEELMGIAHITYAGITIPLLDNKDIVMSFVRNTITIVSRSI